MVGVDYYYYYFVVGVDYYEYLWLVWIITHKFKMYLFVLEERFGCSHNLNLFFNDLFLFIFRFFLLPI